MSTPDQNKGVDLARVAVVAQQLGLRLAVLYGSYAKRKPEPGPESDLDIAVLGCPSDKYWECYEALSDVCGDVTLDLVRLEDADALFRYEVMSGSELLHGDPDLYYEQRAYAFRDFVDSSDLFALENLLFRKKMESMRERLHGSP